MSTTADVPRGSVLVVDDDPDMLKLFQAYLAGAGYSVLLAAAPAEARKILDGGDDAVDAVLLDLMLPEEGGMEFLKAIKARNPHLAVVMVTSSLEVTSAIAAMKAGALDYLLKPVSKVAILEATARAVESAQQARELAVRRAMEPKPLGDEEAVFAGPAIQAVLSLVEHVKDTSVPIMILGESGTGKEVLARYIHRTSRRASHPFVTVNCAALPRELAESELFGHEKGAFTGAASRHRGRFEQAENGTLFLDEVGELDASIQTKLLRVLQEHELSRVGGGTLRTNARVLVATNRDLLADVKAGRFRLDLYYRLEVVTVTLPPLRERREEVGPLAHHLLARFGRNEGLPVKTLASDAVALLQQQDWPGNIRELENVLKRSALISGHAVLHAEDLQFPGGKKVAALPAPPATPVEPGVAVDDETVRKFSEYEPDLMMRALAATRGNVAEAARRLGIGRATFYRRAKRHGLPL